MRPDCFIHVNIVKCIEKISHCKSISLYILSNIAPLCAGSPIPQTHENENTRIQTYTKLAMCVLLMMTQTMDIDVYPYGLWMSFVSEP